MYLSVPAEGCTPRPPTLNHTATDCSAIVESSIPPVNPAPYIVKYVLLREPATSATAVTDMICFILPTYSVVSSPLNSVNISVLLNDVKGFICSCSVVTSPSICPLLTACVSV